MAKQQTVKVQLVRSPIGCKESHRATVRGLGLVAPPLAIPGQHLLLELPP